MTIVSESGPNGAKSSQIARIWPDAGRWWLKSGQPRPTSSQFGLTLCPIWPNSAQTQPNTPPKLAQPCVNFDRLRTTLGRNRPDLVDPELKFGRFRPKLPSANIEQCWSKLVDPWPCFRTRTKCHPRRGLNEPNSDRKRTKFGRSRPTLTRST